MYKAALAAYNTKLQEGLKTVIKTKPTFKEFYLYGQQQKRPNTSLSVSGDIIKECLNIGFSKENILNNIIYEKIPDSFLEDNPIDFNIYNIIDEKNRSFYFNIENQQYKIEKIKIISIQQSKNTDSFLNIGFKPNSDFDYIHIDTVHQNYYVLPELRKVSPSNNIEIENGLIVNDFISLNNLDLKYGLSLSEIPKYNKTLFIDENESTKFFKYPIEYAKEIATQKMPISKRIDFSSIIEILNGSKIIQVENNLLVFKNYNDSYEFIDLNDLNSIYSLIRSMNIKSLDFSKAELR